MPFHSLEWLAFLVLALYGGPSTAITLMWAFTAEGKLHYVAIAAFMAALAFDLAIHRWYWTLVKAQIGRIIGWPVMFVFGHLISNGYDDDEDAATDEKDWRRLAEITLNEFDLDRLGQAEHLLESLRLRNPRYVPIDSRPNGLEWVKGLPKPVYPQPLVVPKSRVAPCPINENCAMQIVCPTAIAASNSPARELVMETHLPGKAPESGTETDLPTAPPSEEEPGIPPLS